MRAKIDRAREHSDFLKAQFDPFVEDNPDAAWGLDIKRKVEEGELTVRWKGTGTPPVVWAVVPGEFFHNVRSAFDHIVCCLVNGDCEGTAFIVRETETDFEGMAKSKLKGVPRAAVDAIKSLQPFNAWPEHPKHSVIWKINELTNRDKHRLLLLSDLHLISQKGRFVYGGEGVAVERRHIARHQRLHDGAKVLHFSWDPAEMAKANPTGQMNVEFQMSLDVSLTEGDWLHGGGQPAGGMPIRHLMDVTLKYMDETALPAFEPYFD